MRRVSDLMTPAPTTVRFDAPASEVTAIMRRLQVRHVPVVDADGALVGIISDRDVLRQQHVPGRSHHAEEDHPLDEVDAERLMSFVVISVPSELPAHVAGQRMLDARVSCLPVIDQGQLVGILTDTDFVRAIVEEDAASAEE